VIEGFENYDVSTLGVVRSRGGVRKGRRGSITILKPAVTGCGYKRVVLCKEGKETTVRIHSLVANAFLPNPDRKPKVDHIDRNKLNNNLENLRWVSDAENSLNHALHDREECGIRWRQDRQCYIVEVTRNKKRFRKSGFKTMEDAKRVKSELLMEILNTRE